MRLLTPPDRPRCGVPGCTRYVEHRGVRQNGTRRWGRRCAPCRRAGRQAALPVGVRAENLPVCGDDHGAPLSPEVIGAGIPGPEAPPERPPVELLAPGVAEELTSQLSLRDAALEPAVIALRLQGVAVNRIAKLLGSSWETINRVARNARAAGKLDDALVDLTHAALPAAVEKLLEKVAAGEDWAIKETLKGLGAFRTYRQQETHRDSESRTLHVKLDLPTTPVAFKSENIVGVPRGALAAPSLPVEGPDATVHPREVGSAAPETVRPGEPGRDRDERGEGEEPRREGQTLAGAGVLADPLAAVLAR